MLQLTEMQCVPDISSVLSCYCSVIAVECSSLLLYDLARQRRALFSHMK